MDCPFWKKVGTILKVDKRRSSTNQPESKKTHDDAYGLHPRDDADRLHISQEKKEEEDSPAFKMASIQRYNDLKTK